MKKKVRKKFERFFFFSWRRHEFIDLKRLAWAACGESKLDSPLNSLYFFQAKLWKLSAARTHYNLDQMQIMFFPVFDLNKIENTKPLLIKREKEVFVNL